MPANCASRPGSLSVSAAGASSFGKFVATVRAGNAAAGVGAQTTVGFRVLPTSAPPPPCRPTLFAVPSGAVLDEVIKDRETMPEITAPNVAYFVPGRADMGWAFEVDPMPDVPIRSGMAVVVLKNLSQRDVEISTVGCSAPGITLRAAPGEVREMMLNSAIDTTLILRHPRKDCFVFCWDGPMEDVATFSPTGFWSLFGGRKVTITWPRWP